MLTKVNIETLDDWIPKPLLLWKGFQMASPIETFFLFLEHCAGMNIEKLPPDEIRMILRPKKSCTVIVK